MVLHRLTTHRLTMPHQLMMPHRLMIQTTLTLHHHQPLSANLLEAYLKMTVNDDIHKALEASPWSQLNRPRSSKPRDYCLITFVCLRFLSPVWALGILE